MLDMKIFKQKTHIALNHYGDCHILAVSDDGTIYAEEFYDETYIAQYKIAPTGEILQVIDENFGQGTIVPLEIPTNSILTQHPTEHPLNHIGLRYQGLREAEKVMEWVKPLAVMEKIPLLKALNLAISPMMIFGIAESRVLSQTKITDSIDMVCRRIQLLRAYADNQFTGDGLPYDYDTISFSLLHPYDKETDTCPSLHGSLQAYPNLINPQDCLYIENTLIVSSNSDGDSPSEIHILKYDDSIL